MDLEMRAVTQEEQGDYIRAVAAGFGEHLDEAGVARWAKVTELDRTIAVFDERQVVASAGAMSFEMTLPGGVAVPVAGVTAVTVRGTHRRRGLLTRMMDHQLDDVARRGEAVAVLGASETAIYSRFGYGQAASYQHWTLRTEGVRFAHPPEPGGRMRVVDAAEAARVVPAVFERARRRHPGQVSRSPGLWEAGLFDDPAEDREGASALFFVVHESSAGVPDGIAAYRRKGDWAPGGLPNGELRASPELFAVDDEVEAALWAFLIETDLVRTVRAEGRPVDEPLRWRLADPRRLQTTVVSDSLWLRVLDVGAALGARRYATSDRLVIELVDPFRPANDGRWRIEGGPDGASCARTGDAADLALTAPDLGAVYLGGVAPSVLARAGRVRELRPDALRRADAFLASSPAPWCATDF
jgi:predicted acetyltransferase